VCAFCILVDSFLNAQLVSTDNLISWSFTIYDHLLSDSVRNVCKAMWEWLKYWLFVWGKFGFEKSHGNRNFGFDLLVSVRIFKNRNQTKIWVLHITSGKVWWKVTAADWLTKSSRDDCLEIRISSSLNVCIKCGTTFTLYILYILLYKSKTEDTILALKARGSTYMRGKLSNNFCRHRHGTLST